MKWNEDMIPLIFLALGDQDFLARKNLFLVMSANINEKESEMILGKVLRYLNLYFFL